MSQRPLSTLSLAPSTLSVLTRAGYETIQDLASCSVESLAKDLKVPLQTSQTILNSARSRGKARLSTSTSELPPPPLTQSAASMISSSSSSAKYFSTLCPALDKLLGAGGLRRGYILEIAGPPGTKKEALAVNVVGSVVKDGGEVVFVDMQNMVMPAILCRDLQDSGMEPGAYKTLIRHANIQDLTDLMIFLNNLPSYLDTNPRTTLLVLNSLQFPFQSQSPPLTQSQKNGILERIKSILARSCAGRNLSVVITTQLSTKMVNPEDGSTSNFDKSGSRGIMLPSLGSAHLPSGRTYRVLISPTSRTSGYLRLLASPTGVQGNAPVPEEPYELVDGVMS
ncbi:hypothetical protein JAAARDRAFT_54165 [Jaapia argillacea MUCL 33604]|uniref:RecA family profile 1 domain-containing protein n=1 Tax=Jaapia argillacea MUCL 33604 TaxID=933084 RepID=A0A067QF73_9AGAM|nr:hypothetical protein JAAARDRAFT_54165 [Jaapia argillacea MUCL 33604]